MRVYFIILLFYTLSANAQHWEGVGGGTDLTYWTVYGLYNDDSLLHVCGGFDSIAGGSIESQGYGLWNGNNWLSSNVDFTFGAPKCFIKYNGTLHFAGAFQRVNGNKYCRNIARQDSAGNWISLGSGVTTGSVVNCMSVYNGDLFIGGQFTEVDSTIVARRIARWDGSSWHAMGSGFQGGFGNVNSMAVFQNELYVGGFFAYIDGIHAPGICRWNGTNWDTLTSGTNGPVECLYVDTINNRLYVGGQFTVAGGINSPTGVAYWDGTNWFSVGSSPYIPANVIFHFDGILYNLTIASDAVNSNGDTINHFAWFDGVNWNPVPGGELSSRGNCFTIYQNELYIGGSFQYAGDSLVNGIAKWIPGSLGTGEVPEGKMPMKIMPNPAKDEVVLELNLQKPAKLELQVSNVSGKIILNETLSGNGAVIHKIKTSEFTSGIYMFSVYENNKLIGSEKVVIQK
jgi:hypothetical protein